MNKLTYLFVIILLVTISCKNDKKSQTETSLHTMNQNDSIGKLLFEQKCIACHGFEGKTEEQMIAPPMYAVKRRYLRETSDEEKFTELMRNWVKNPVEEKSLMTQAKDTLGIMPHLNYSEDDISKIVQYIYDTEMPKPDWFDAHQKANQKSKLKNFMSN